LIDPICVADNKRIITISLSKSKTPASTSNIAIYSKEEFGNFITQLQNEKAQIVTAYERVLTKKTAFEISKDRFI